MIISLLLKNFYLHLTAPTYLVSLLNDIFQILIPEIASDISLLGEPRCFGTAKVGTFFTSAKLILKFFVLLFSYLQKPFREQPASSFAGCKGKQLSQFCKHLPKKKLKEIANSVQIRWKKVRTAIDSRIIVHGS
jgi:hypothetical protein